MNYQEFVSLIQEKVTGLLASEINIHTYDTIRNNDSHRTGLVFSQKDINISPAIYLEEYYMQYEDGRDADSIAENIASLYDEIKCEQSWDARQVQEFELARPRLVYKLIHYEKNKKLLSQLPHISFFDLAIVFYLLLDCTEKGTATIPVTNTMLEHWGICKELLYQLAKVNTPKLLPAEYLPMHSLIHELLGEEDYEEEESYLYVLSNVQRHFGAACMLYPDILEKIGETLDCDYYLLPSSIHELIILPASTTLTLAEINEMIVEINDSQVPKEEVLSDHTYYYSRAEAKLLSPT
ncbi:MAG: DUF5688 family protein [Faecalimonas sp.]|nr:DUF5688 family protein [Faecalimonas sp.]